MASLHITLFGKGPFWSMCWVSYQANLRVFDRADIWCFHIVCSLIESVQQSQNEIHKEKPWYQINQLGRDESLGMTFQVLTVHEAFYQVSQMVNNTKVDILVPFGPFWTTFERWQACPVWLFLVQNGPFLGHTQSWTADPKVKKRLITTSPMCGLLVEPQIAPFGT